MNQSILSLIFTLLAFIFATDVCANKQVDSFKKQLAHQRFNDTNKVLLQIELAHAYENINQDSFVLFAEKAILLSNSLHFEKGSALALAALGRACEINGDLDRGVNALKKAISIAYKLNNKGMIASFYSGIANIYRLQSKLVLAYEYYNASANIAKEIRDSNRLVINIGSISEVYALMGDYQNSIKSGMQALETYERLNDSINIAYALSNLSGKYIMLQQYDLAASYNAKSITINKTIYNRKGLMMNYYLSGNIYNAQYDYQKALKDLQIALEIANSIGESNFIYTILNDIASNYKELDDASNALKYYDKALVIAQKTGNMASIADISVGIAEIHMLQKEYRKAIKLLESMYTIMKEEKVLIMEHKIAERLFTAYELAHNYPKAFYYSRITNDLGKALYDQDVKSEIAKYEFGYQLGKRNQEIASLQKDKKIIQVQTEKQKVMLRSIAAVSLLMLVIIVLLYHIHQKEKKRQQQLLQQKHEIELQAEKLKELNSFKDITFAVLAHDLRSPVSTLTNMVMFLNDDTISPAMFKDFLPEIVQKMSSLNTLLDNLLHWSKAHISGGITSNSVYLPVSNIIQDNVRLYQSEAVRKDLSFSLSVPEDVVALADKGQTDIVVRNLIANALKFSKRNGIIYISGNREGDKVSIRVKDEGVGMTKEQAAEVFSVKEHKSTYGTDGEKGIGIGLQLCYEFVKQNNGSISVNSEVNQGTEFIVVLPAYN